MKGKRVLGWMLALILLGLCGCRRQVQSCQELLESVMAEESTLPAGACYFFGVEEGQTGYFNGTVMRAMYGEDAGEIFDLLEDYGIYLSSFASPSEIAIFRCRSPSDVGQVEAMCRNRVDQLCVALRGTVFFEQAETARIARDGRTVVMVMTEDSAATLHTLKGLMD